MAKSGRTSVKDVSLGSIVLLVLGVAAAAFGGLKLWKAYQPQEPVEPPVHMEEEISEPAEEQKPVGEEPQNTPEEKNPEEQIPEDRNLEAEVTVEEPKQVTLMAVGDNLIHNTVYWSAELPGGGYDFSFIYDDIAPLVQEYDLACIQQETIYVEDPSQYGNYPSFGTPVQVGEALVNAGFDVITQASNHCFDRLETGIRDTVHFWQNYPDVTMLGIHETQEDADALKIVEKNGIRIAMFNYTYGLNYSVPQQSFMVDTLSKRDEMAADLQRGREEADFVLVFAHWGEEDMFKANEEQKGWAQFFADQGVDLVIGTHPHVVEPVEVYTNCDGEQMPVFYSLGNFLSHQLDPVNMLGAMASVTITKDEEHGTYVSSYELKPTINIIIRRPTGWFDYRPMLLENYTEELAAQHRVEGTGVETMWNLYNSIVNP